MPGSNGIQKTNLISDAVDRLRSTGIAKAAAGKRRVRCDCIDGNIEIVPLSAT
jgi:hypothetical protein